MAKFSDVVVIRRSTYDRERFYSVPEGESLTKQSFQDEVDINSIMARYTKTGILPSGPSVPHFGDFSDGLDFQESLNRVIAAQGAFMALPAEVRSRFGNDPASMIEFIHDPNNFDEAVKLGLLVVRDEPAAQPSPKAEAKPEADKPSVVPDKA